MAIRVCSSLDFSRLGIEIYVPLRREVKGNTRFFKMVKNGKVRWKHVHEPSLDYLHARKEFEKTFSTGCTNMKMGDWIFRRKREQEAFENRCATLAARMMNHLCK